MKKKYIKLSEKEVAVMKKNSKKGSKLLPFKDDIIYMYTEKISFSEITKWLNYNEIATTSENVRQFCKRYAYQYENFELVLSDENGPTDDQNGGDSQNEEDDEYEDDDIAYSDL